jgi:hypothetical protein
MKLRNTVAALAVAAGVLGSAAPAHAAWVMTVEGQNTGISISDRLTMTAECSALATDGAGTVIQDCYFQSLADGKRYDVKAQPHGFPGPTDVVVGTAEVNPAHFYKVCVRAMALVTAGNFSQSPTHCVNV